MSTLLETEGLSKAFGGVRAVAEVTVEVEAGSIFGVIGPNGSGKTTLLGLLSGTYRPDAGTIRLQGRRLDGLAAHRMVAAGIVRTFQTTRLFFSRTVRDNVAVASAELRGGRRVSHGSALLELVGLPGREDTACHALSNAEQRLAMVAVAMATQPAVLLLDEPAVGMTRRETQVLAGVIRRIRDERAVTVLIVEHNMHFMMGLADRIMVMNAGRKLTEGTPEAVRRDKRVIESYLGATG